LDNKYLVDCQAFTNSCGLNDVINITVLDDGSGYYTNSVTVTITPGGFDIAPNRTLNTPANSSLVIVDDSTLIPLNEIDLVAGNNRTVFCNATLTDSDGFTGIASASAVLYDIVASSPSATDNEDNHYSNSSCLLFSGSGTTRGVECSFPVIYHSNNATWRCNVTTIDNLSATGFASEDSFTINELVALDVSSILDYGELSLGSTSVQRIVNVTNLGNIQIDIKIYGFANNFTTSPNSFNCTSGTIANITLANHRYNVTVSGIAFGSMFRLLNETNEITWSSLNLSKKLSSETKVSLNKTYWRVQIPSSEIGGTCRGVISYTAVKSS